MIQQTTSVKLLSVMHTHSTLKEKRATCLIMDGNDGEISLTKAQAVEASVVSVFPAATHCLCCMRTWKYVVCIGEFCFAFWKASE